MGRKKQPTEYNGIVLTNSKQLENAFCEKYPNGFTAFLEDITVDNIRRYIYESNIYENSFVEAICEKEPEESNGLKVQLKVTDYYSFSPIDFYQDEEMDKWIDENCRYRNEEDYPDSRSSIFLHQHPELEGGKIWFDEDSRAIDLELLVEGKPFWMAVSLVLHNPEITTEKIRVLLRNEEEISTYLKGIAESKERSEHQQLLNLKKKVFAYEIGSLGYLMFKKDIYLYCKHECGQPLEESFRMFVDFQIFQMMNIVMDWRKIMGFDFKRVVVDIPDFLSDVECEMTDNGSYRVRCAVDGVQKSYKHICSPESAVLDALAWMYGNDSDEFKFELYKNLVNLYAKKRAK